MNRVLEHFHPKLVAAFVTFVALIGVFWLAEVALGIDLSDTFEGFVKTTLPFLAAYLKSGD